MQAFLVSVLTSGIQPQPMPPVQIMSSFAYSTNHLFTLKWSSTPGLNYQVLQTGELGAPVSDPARSCWSSSFSLFGLACSDGTLTQAAPEASPRRERERQRAGPEAGAPMR